MVTQYSNIFYIFINMKLINLLEELGNEQKVDFSNADLAIQPTR